MGIGSVDEPLGLAAPAALHATAAASGRHAVCERLVSICEAALFRANSTGFNDERDQTLNQLLTEMDGFDGYHPPPSLPL
jgi:hypothetical protein